VTKCNNSRIRFPGIQHKRVEIAFDGGSVTSDGGGILLREADRRQGLLKRVAHALGDGRQSGKCEHTALHVLRQRVFGLALGYEDLVDHDSLRHDPAFQTFVGRESPLASSSTLSRFENAQGRRTAVAINTALVEHFVASFKKPPKELVLDFDTKASVVHGKQEGRFFHGHYDEYCMLPLYVFCGRHLLVAYFRPSDWDNALHSGSVLKLLVRRFRQAWPDVRVVFRADSGFCRPWLLSWCDRNDVEYIVGLAKNPVLLRLGAKAMEKARRRYLRDDKKSRAFDHFRYAARTWKRSRRVIIRAEHGSQGANPRFVVTSLRGRGKTLYEDVYCARGEAENRIKEQVALFCDRISAHRWWANQFRILLSALAYTLIEGLRSIAFHGTSFPQAQPETLRCKLFKIGAVITRNTRRVVFHMSSSYPWQRDFRRIAAAFSTA